MATEQITWFATDGTQWSSLADAERQDLYRALARNLEARGCEIPLTVAGHIMSCFSQAKVKELIK